MSSIARETCLISPHSVHTWSQSGVDQSESIMEFYDSCHTHTPPTLSNPVWAWVKTNEEWSNADSRFSTPSQLHTLNLSWCQDLQRWWPLMTPVRENNQWSFVVRGGRFHLLKALPSATSREITHSLPVLWVTCIHSCAPRNRHTNSKQMCLVWIVSVSACKPFMSSGERAINAFIPGFQDRFI